ncbi:MAG TPA: cupin domain-containing protein [Lunatimonas sp.]|nr:cupin domain-containing protein [Lunatimonas sp.]
MKVIPFVLLSILWVFPTFGQEEKIKIARLSQGDSSGLELIREEFGKRNPGYDMRYLSGVDALQKHDLTQVIFVQEGGGTAILRSSADQYESSKVSVGDILLLRKGETLEVDSLLGLLVFTVPEKPKDHLPAFVRPDWDPNITDEPGGCATETNAYRRILLTWKKEVGNYVYHAINAHRVRIMDSFSHYHPETIGFDEFYLVQMVLPDAKLITSEKVDLLSNPENVTKDQVQDLFKEYTLEVGDLVYLPRGVMHRGVGGVLAQVITVPGFIPGAEYGVDHFIREINERLNLRGNEALPFNRQASAFQIIK